jgi:predicted amidophosphoribosyltransferase
MTRQRAYQLKRLQRGLCQECGKRPANGRTMCEGCAKKLKDSMRRRYHERKSMGLCVYCGKRPRVSGIACVPCRTKLDERRQRRRSRTGDVAAVSYNTMEAVALVM